MASARGTLLHWHAEIHLNGGQVAHPHSPEFSMFLAVLDVLQQHLGLRPWRTEVSLFHVGLCLAGQADALFVDARGDIVILDWKRTQCIRFDNPFRSMKEPLDHLPDANGWYYGLQLNVYRYMLETEYGLHVSAMFLGQVHPCLSRAKLIRVPCMREELELIVEDQIHRGEAVSPALPDATFALPSDDKMCVAPIARSCECEFARSIINSFLFCPFALCSALSLIAYLYRCARTPGSRGRDVLG